LTETLATRQIFTANQMYEVIITTNAEMPGLKWTTYDGLIEILFADSGFTTGLVNFDKTYVRSMQAVNDFKLTNFYRTS
jgi:hypothetical protein